MLIHGKHLAAHIPADPSKHVPPVVTRFLWEMAEMFVAYACLSIVFPKNVAVLMMVMCVHVVVVDDSYAWRMMPSLQD